MNDLQALLRAVTRNTEMIGCARALAHSLQCIACTMPATVLIRHPESSSADYVCDEHVDRIKQDFHSHYSVPATPVVEDLPQVKIARRFKQLLVGEEP